MAYGLSVLNKDAQILISSQTKTLHFVGKATYSQLLGSIDQCGGMRCWRFTIECTTTPVPFLTMPTSDFYAVIGVRQVGPTTWAIEVLRSGTSASIPEVYVFADPNGITYTGPETYGMRVYCDDGSLSFDSRLSPLVVTGGLSVAPPASPTNPAWYDYVRYDPPMTFTEYTVYPSYYHYYYAFNSPYNTRGSQFNVAGDKGTGNPSAYLTPTQSNPYSFSVGVGNTKPIYFFPSFAQATRLVLGIYTSGDTYRCDTNYWALYRGGIRRSEDTLSCGWVPYVQGKHWLAKRIDTGTTVGSGVDASSIVGAGAGGMPPYYNETLNLQPTAVIIANGARYD